MSFFTHHAPVFVMFLPLLFAGLVAFISCKKTSFILTLLASALVLFCSISLIFAVLQEGVIIYNLGGWLPPVGIEYRVDIMSTILLFIVSLLGFLSIIYAHSSGDEISGRHYAMFLLGLGALNGISVSNDAFHIYVLIEISSIAAYVMIAMGKNRLALLASFQYLVLGTIGATFILTAIGMIYMLTGSLAMHQMAEFMANDDSIVKYAAAAMLLIGIALKAAIFPFHNWLVGAYSSAPSYVSLFLSATATKVAILLIIRFYYSVFGLEFSQQIHLSDVLIFISLIAIIYGSVLACYEMDIRRILAYSSISQIGYMVLAIALFTESGLAAGLSHMLAHAFAKGLFFAASGVLLMRFGTTHLAHLRGFARVMPLTFIFIIIAGLGLIGVPLTAGFISKWFLLSALYEQQLWHIMAIVLFSSLLAVAYVWRIIEVGFFEEKHSVVRLKKLLGDKQEMPRSMAFVMLVLASLLLVFGVSTFFNGTLAFEAARQIMGGL